MESAEHEHSQAYLYGMSKAAQQKLRYALYCQVGKVFNETDSRRLDSGSEMVKLHLGLKALVLERGLMDM